MRRLGHAGWAAALLACVAIVGFGAALDGYAQRAQPIALLGARGVAHALWFNITAFILPGLLAALVAIRLRGGMDARTRWATRIGARLTMLAALAYAAQGVLPLDVDDLDTTIARLHAIAWSAWWIAFASGGLLLAWGFAGVVRTHWMAWVSGIAALAVMAFAVPAAQILPAAIAQRLACAIWFVWLIVVPFALAAPDANSAGKP